MGSLTIIGWKDLALHVIWGRMESSVGLFLRLPFFVLQHLHLGSF